MTTLQEQLQTAVDQTTADSNIFHDIVHGDTSTEVATENGNVKSVAKVVDENQQTLNASIATLTAMRDEAVTSADNAATSESNSNTSANNALGSENKTLAAVGAVANNYLFDDANVMEDPTSGALRFNHADLTQATNIAISAQTAENTSPDISEFIKTWGSSTSNIKGLLTIKKAGSPETFAVLAITGAVTDNDTWLQIPITHITGNGVFDLSDDIYISFTKTGDKGDGDLVSGNNLSELTDIPQARTNLEIASSATEYSKTQNFDATTLVDTANIAWNLENNQVATVTLGGNRILDNPTNMKDGATYILTVKQDATGSRSLAYNAVFKFAGGEAPTISTNANAVDILTFVSDGINMYGVMQGDFK